MTTPNSAPVMDRSPDVVEQPVTLSRDSDFGDTLTHASERGAMSDTTQLGPSSEVPSGHDLINGVLVPHSNTTAPERSGSQSEKQTNLTRRLGKLVVTAGLAEGFGVGVDTVGAVLNATPLAELASGLFDNKVYGSPEVSASTRRGELAQKSAFLLGNMAAGTVAMKYGPEAAGAVGVTGLPAIGLTAAAKVTGMKAFNGGVSRARSKFSK